MGSSAGAAAARQGTYLAAHYHRLVQRMGKSRAPVAMAYPMRIIVYHSRPIAHMPIKIRILRKSDATGG